MVSSCDVQYRQHLRFAGLKAKQIDDLFVLAHDILKLKGVFSRRTRLTYLAGELYTVRSQIAWRDGEHLQAIVVYEGFKGKSLIDQHRMVTDPIKDELKGPVHALSIQTKERE